MLKKPDNPFCESCWTKTTEEYGIEDVCDECNCVFIAGVAARDKQIANDPELRKEIENIVGIGLCDFSDHWASNTMGRSTRDEIKKQIADQIIALIVKREKP